MNSNAQRESTCPVCHGTHQVQMDFGVLQGFPCYACHPDWWKANPAPWMRAAGMSLNSPALKDSDGGDKQL